MWIVIDSQIRVKTDGSLFPLFCAVLGEFFLCRAECPQLFFYFFFSGARSQNVWNCVEKVTVLTLSELNETNGYHDDASMMRQIRGSWTAARALYPFATPLPQLGIDATTSTTYHSI
jgi:hypothetical protein